MAIKLAARRAAKFSAALFLIFSGLILIPTLRAATVVTDNFEADTAGTTPAGWTNRASNTGACGFTTSTTNPHTGAQDAAFTGNGAGALFSGPPLACDTGITGMDLCAGNTWNFWMFIPTGTFPSGDFLEISPEDTSGAGVIFAIDGTHGFFGFTTPTFTNLAPGAVPFNQWVDFAISGTCTGGSNIYQITSIASGFSVSYSSTHVVAITRFLFAARHTDPSHYPTATWTFYVDDLGTTAYAGLTPTATSSPQTNIVGFDIGKNGASLITRSGTAGSQQITTIRASDMSQTFSTNTNCNRLNGVVGIADRGFAYIHCRTSDNTPDSLNFIDGTGGSFQYDNCNNPGESCPQSYDLTGITFAERSGYNDPAMFTPGFDYTSEGSGFSNGHVISAQMGVSDSTGNFESLGVAHGYFTTAASNSVEVKNQAIADLGAGNSQDDVCGYGNLKIFRTEGGSPVKGYTLTEGVHPSAITTAGDFFTPSTVQTFTGSSDALLTAQHIDCANNRIIATSATQLTVWRYDTNTLLFTIPITPSSASVAYNTINGNGSYLAYSDGTKTHVLSGVDGHELAFFINPGTLIDEEMDNCAQSIFVATSTNTYRYNITANTTGTPVTVQNGNCVISGGIGSSSTSGTTSPCSVFGCTPSTTGGSTAPEGPAQHTGNPIGDFLNILNTNWGFDWSWIIGAAILVVVLIAADKFSHGSPIVDGVVIAVLTVLNVKLGFWGSFTIILMFFVAAAVVGNRAFNRRETDVA